MADEQEQGRRRRLLEHLEKRIGGLAFQIIGRVDDDHPPRAHRGGHAEHLAEPADLVDRDVAREASGGALKPLELAVIGMAARGEQARGGMRVVDEKPVPAGWRPSRFGEHALGGGLGDACLAEPARPREQPRVVHPLARPRRPQLLDRALLSYDPGLTDDHGIRSASA